MNNLKTIFAKCRIVGLAGIKNSGKTNNLVRLIKDYRQSKPHTDIFAYGMPISVMTYLKGLDVKEISSMRHLVHKKNCILIIDEFQKLKLNDRRCKDTLDEFIDFVYHNNVYVIFSSPNIREFNSVIGGVIEQWLLKTVRKDMCINGSQLKKVVEEYNGRFKSLGAIEVPKDTLLLINDTEEVIMNCKYLVDADSKIDNQGLF